MTKEQEKTAEETIPEYYKKLKFYNWRGVYYYNNWPCEKVDNAIAGNIIEHIGDRIFSADLHDTGFIIGTSIGGKINLKVKMPFYTKIELDQQTASLQSKSDRYEQALREIAGYDLTPHGIRVTARKALEDI